MIQSNLHNALNKVITKLVKNQAMELLCAQNMIDYSLLFSDSRVAQYFLDDSATVHVVAKWVNLVNDWLDNKLNLY